MKNNFVFPPQNIQKIVKERGFFVYQYISRQELFASIKKDFLEVLEKARWVLLGVIIISYLSTESVETVLLALGVSYVLVSFYLLGRLFWRTKHFLYLNNVVFSEKALITGKKVLPYSDTNLEPELRLYEKIFDEFLTRESALKRKIQEKWSYLKQNDTGLFQKLMKNKDIGRNNSFGSEKNASKIKILAGIAIAVYVLSIFVFYYLGIAIISVVFYVFSFGLSMYLLAKNRPEHQIKTESEKIHIAIETMNYIWKSIEQEFESFKDGEISDLESFLKGKIDLFYKESTLVLLLQKKLNVYIKENFTSNLINFATFETYVWKEMQKPMTGIYELLIDSKTKNEQQLREIKNTSKKTKDPVLKTRLEQKELHFELQNKELEQQIQKLKILKKQGVV